MSLSVVASRAKGDMM